MAAVQLMAKAASNAMDRFMESLVFLLWVVRFRNLAGIIYNPLKPSLHGPIEEKIVFGGIFATRHCCGIQTRIDKLRTVALMTMDG